MIVMMAGLPGTGKSTLARALAAKLHGIVLDKDEIRSALFPAAEIEYSTAQDDFVIGVMLQTADYLLRKDPGRYVFLDGRPFSRRYQVERVIEFAKNLGQDWRIVECVCLEETVRQRMEEQKHPAGNRDFELYRRVKARFEKIEFPKLEVNTERPLEQCIAETMLWLQ